MASVWIQALRKWNQGKPSWCIPRRGSADHAAVRAEMARIRTANAAAGGPGDRPKEHPLGPPAKAKRRQANMDELRV